MSFSYVLNFFFDEYEKEGTSGDPYSHVGEECGVVLQGRLEVSYDDKKYILENISKKSVTQIAKDLSKKIHPTATISTGTRSSKTIVYRLLPYSKPPF